MPVDGALAQLASRKAATKAMDRFMGSLDAPRPMGESLAYFFRVKFISITFVFDSPIIMSWISKVKASLP